MVRAMRIVNILIIALIVAGSAASVMQNFGDSAQTVGNLIGMGLLVAPFYFAWRGLCPTSTLSMATNARVANTTVAALIVLGLLLLLVYSDDATTVLSFIPISVVVGVPVLLNIIALGKRKAEIEQAKTELETNSTALDIPSPASTRTLLTPIPVSTSNYFVRHWRGDLSLPVSYWVNGAVLVTVASVVLVAAVEQMSNGNYSLRAISLAGLGVVLFSVTAWLWSVVGIWRSADYHVARGGASVWASLAKIMVVVGFIAMANQLTNNLLPMVKEYVLIASGNDPFGKVDVKVSTNGQSVIVIGGFGEGSSAEIKRILDAAPSATSLVLNSKGGRILEARRLARIVRDRNLDTYVESQCVSACTYVFLAGRDRAATPNARFGFHQPTFPGLDANAQRGVTQDMLDVYRSAGLPEQFIERISTTPPEEMWYPTRDELIASNVVTRMSLGGEAATLTASMNSKREFVLLLKDFPLSQAYEIRFPGTISEAVEQGWTAKESGANDTEVMNIMRNVFTEAFTKVIQTADDATLDGYADLLVDQLLAIKAVSSEACAKYLEGKLDITKFLPKEITEKELKLTIEALEKPPRADLTSPNPTKVEQALQAAVANLSQQDMSVIADMNAYAGQPSLVCNATLALYQGIQALPYDQRIYALRGMFQSDI